MSGTCHEILRHLAIHGPTVATRLADALNRAPKIVARCLHQLSDRGLVVSRVLPQGGRPGRAPAEWAIAPANEPMAQSAEGNG